MLSDTSLTKSFSLRSIAASLSSDVLFIIATSTHPDLYIRQLILLSQVCRHWRYSLLSSPSLWAKIEYPDLNLSLLNMVLTRSGDCSLEVTLYLDDYVENDEKIVYHHCNLIFAHIHRIDTLTLSGSWSSAQKLLEHIYSLLDDPASKFRMVRFYQLFILKGTSVRFPGNFLHNVAPQLKGLYISSAFLSYQKTPIFKSMTHLSLISVKDITSVARLLDILEATSSSLILLELLDLRDLASNRAELGNHFIQLSSLQYLSLRLNPSPLMLVLHHIKFPPNINWDVDCADAINDRLLDITPLLRFLKQTRASGTSLSFGIHSEYVANLDDSNHPATLDMYFKTSPTALTSDASLKMNIYPYEGRTNTDRLKRLFSDLGFSQMLCSKVNIHCLDPDPYTDIVGLLFSSLSGLQGLSIVCLNVKVSLSFIHQLWPTRTPSLPCPRLIDLTLRSATTEDKSWFKVLGNRKAAGNILTNLRVFAMPYDPSIQAELELLVKNVVLIPA